MLAAILGAFLGALWAQEEAKVAVAGGEVGYFHSPVAGTESRPLVVVLAGGGANPEAVKALYRQWQIGWNVVTPLVSCGSDPGVKALDLIVADARKRLPVAPSRTYLVGAGPAASEVFYTVSRLPDPWAAALAIQGNPTPAVNSNRLFGANTGLVPVLWVNPPPAAELSRQKLAAARFNFETPPGLSDAQILEWLARRHKDPYPFSIDCETGAPALSRCYWIQMTKFDPRKRNNALGSTRVAPGSGAALGFGPFAYDPSAEGPGALVAWLPGNSSAPLRPGDRITSIAGHAIRDGRDYARFMDQMSEEKTVAVVIERGKERLRKETRVVLPKREELLTALVQATYTPDQKEVL
ncbi:MAG: hypothetical protein HYR60_08825, partial [Acidobacteria bacterium]|nr:hypothetical protein [Acidobacteriota bacterium]